MSNFGFKYNYEEEDFINNAIAICNNIIELINNEANRDNKLMTPRDERRIINNELSHERLSLVKDGLYMCSCCKSHKRDCPGIYYRIEQQIDCMVKSDNLLCQCPCKRYLQWLHSLEHDNIITPPLSPTLSPKISPIESLYFSDIVGSFIPEEMDNLNN